MKKIYLFCTAGMSTSLMASKMQDVANKNNLPVEVKAYTDKIIGKIIEEEHPDVILLGPQVKYLYESVVEQYGNIGTPIDVIDSKDYGLMDGERVLKKALILLKQNQK